jgi:hypothetical protein
MITKEELKKEVDKLPDNLLEEVYALLKAATQKKKDKNVKITLRNFKGSLDKVHIRNTAHE